MPTGGATAGEYDYEEQISTLCSGAGYGRLSYSDLLILMGKSVTLMLGDRNVEIAPRINVDPNIHHGTPVIAGTRVPVSIVLGSLAGGMSKEEVMQEYELTKEDVEAALAYAADLVSKTSAVPLAET